MKVRRNMFEWAVFAAVLALVLGVLVRYTRSAGGGVNYAVLVGVLIPTLIYAVFAMGINLQFGFTGLINFGQVAFMAIGAYTVALFTLPAPRTGLEWYADNPSWTYGWSVGAAVLFAVVLSIGLAALVGMPTLRLREDYLAIVTIGIAEIVRIMIQENPDWTRGTQPVLSTVAPFKEWALSNAAWLRFAEAFGVTPYKLLLFGLLVATIALVFLAYEALVRLPYGRVIRAIREDEEVARALGKNVFVFKMQVLALGGVVGALSGAFLFWHFGSVTPGIFLPIVTFYGWIIVVTGGAGNNKGTILGAALLWALFFEGTRYVPVYEQLGFSSTDGANFRILAIGVLLMALMTFRPQGILGRKEELAFAK